MKYRLDEIVLESEIKKEYKLEIDKDRYKIYRRNEEVLVVLPDDKNSNYVHIYLRYLLK